MPSRRDQIRLEGRERDGFNLEGVVERERQVIEPPDYGFLHEDSGVADGESWTTNESDDEDEQDHVEQGDFQLDDENYQLHDEESADHVQINTSAGGLGLALRTSREANDDLVMAKQLSLESYLHEQAERIVSGQREVDDFEYAMEGDMGGFEHNFSWRPEDQDDFAGRSDAKNDFILEPEELFGGGRPRQQARAFNRSPSVSIRVKPSDPGQDGVEKAMGDVKVEVPPTGCGEHEARVMEGVEVEGVEAEGVEVGAGQLSVVAGSAEDPFEVKQEEIEAATPPDRDDKPEPPKDAPPPVLQQPSPSPSPHEVTHALPLAVLPPPTEGHRSHLPLRRSRMSTSVLLLLNKQFLLLLLLVPSKHLPSPLSSHTIILSSNRTPDSLRQKPFSHPHPQRSVAQSPLFRPLPSASNETSSSVTANGSSSGAGTSVSSLRIAGIASASSTATVNALPSLAGVLSGPSLLARIGPRINTPPPRLLERIGERLELSDAVDMSRRPRSRRR
ncbi:hypothetical protein JCM10296v2_005193 [Rhodotorula toruloides]